MRAASVRTALISRGSNARRFATTPTGPSRFRVWRSERTSADSWACACSPRRESHRPGLHRRRWRRLGRFSDDRDASNGFASIPTSQSIDDGLALTDAYIAAAVRCAPPDNKPTPEEIHACQPHLEAELAHLPNVQVVVALGKIAFDVWWRVMASRGCRGEAAPAIRSRRNLQAEQRSPSSSPRIIQADRTRTPESLTPQMMSDVFQESGEAPSGRRLATSPTSLGHRLAIAVRLLVRVIRAAHQRTRLDVREAHVERNRLQVAEFVGMVVARHRQVRR